MFPNILALHTDEAYSAHDDSDVVRVLKYNGTTPISDSEDDDDEKPGKKKRRAADDAMDGAIAMIEKAITSNESRFAAKIKTEENRLELERKREEREAERLRRQEEREDQA
jgi:hypothetical protein